MNLYARTSRLRVPRLGWLLVAAVLALAGCGDPVPGGDTAGDPAAATGPLLAFTATSLGGKPFDGMSLAGKPAVLWFWAPWCPICLGQAPGVREAVAQHGSEVNIVGVAGLADLDAMPEFVRLAKVEAMTHLADEAGEVWKRFEVTEQSVFVLINAAGQITFRGRLDAGEVPDLVAALRG